ncbi:unnamed protein product [Cylicostephanus goldi]|uniref:Uncharacterized protein n=1 Tax=Cylicostephanus goldi TaxID=71465 RepID=A0A3P7NZ86_CYLGO|nr:unnamed protein product [Cylicostephanus goldi]
MLTPPQQITRSGPNDTIAGSKYRMATSMCAILPRTFAVDRNMRAERRASMTAAEPVIQPTRQRLGATSH